MYNTVAEIFDLKSEAKLREAFCQLELELIDAIAPLEESLNKTVGSMDPQVNYNHGDFVGSWRNRICKYLMFVTAFLEHAKSDNFMMPKAPGVTDEIRKQHMRGLSGPYEAWKGRLEKLVEDIDNRVNWCKKCVETESQGGRRAFRNEF